jgi:hypothetical protein
MCWISVVRSSYIRIFSASFFITILCPENAIYKVVQIWPGRFVCKQVTVCPGHIWTTLYNSILFFPLLLHYLHKVAWNFWWNCTLSIRSLFQF